MNVTLPALSQTHLLFSILLFAGGYALRHFDPFKLHVAAVVAAAVKSGIVIAEGQVVRIGKHLVTLLGDGTLDVKTPAPQPAPKVTTVAPSA